MTLHDTLALFLNTLAISLPTFGWVVLGLLLQRAGLLTEPLNNRISLLAFNYGLPLMLFAGAAQVDYGDLSHAAYLLAGLLATFVTVASSWLYSRWRGHPRARQGIFVQAAYRSNLAIIGLALAVSAYGEGATALAALPVALMTILYNVLAVWVLGVTHGSATRVSAMLLGVLRNPLVIGIGAGIVLSLSPLPVPALMKPAGAALSAFFLPVVLVCIGGAMNVSRLYRADRFTWEACAWRLGIAPLIGLALALALGVRGETLGVIYLLLATPVAASSHVMVVAARGDGTLAANIVVLSTLLSVLTITLGLFFLSLLSLIGELR